VIKAFVVAVSTVNGCIQKSRFVVSTNRYTRESEVEAKTPGRRSRVPITRTTDCKGERDADRPPHKTLYVIKSRGYANGFTMIQS
jgi:hypothetical protein